MKDLHATKRNTLYLLARKVDQGKEIITERMVTFQLKKLLL